jgi:peptidyl-prolyl cis-trans isomerase C
MGKIVLPSPAANFAEAIAERIKSGRAAASRILLLREPLVQFLLIGLVLFVAYGALNPGAGQSGSYQIVLTTDDLRQLESTFAAQWQRAPSPEESRGLIEQKIREEILYREALQLGLDNEDVIIKRRLAQKMQFLAEDVASAREPTTAELKAWYIRNSGQFALPSRLSFRHLYFSPDHRGQWAHDDAMKALTKISGEREESKAAAVLTDRFMFQDYYVDRTPEELEKDFGTQFAAAVQKLKPGFWQGPVESGYGWHLVFVDSVIPGRIPVFEEVEANVKSAWLADQKQRAWHKAYQDMRAKYAVLLPAISDRITAAMLTVSPKIEIPTASGETPE